MTYWFIKYEKIYLGTFCSHERAGNGNSLPLKNHYKHWHQYFTVKRKLTSPPERPCGIWVDFLLPGPVIYGVYITESNPVESSLVFRPFGNELTMVPAPARWIAFSIAEGESNLSTYPIPMFSLTVELNFEKDWNTVVI